MPNCTNRFVTIEKQTFDSQYFHGNERYHKSKLSQTFQNFPKMEVETTFQPIRAQDSVENNDARLDSGFANELEAYNGLQLDFESEFSDFLTREVPRNGQNETKTDNNERRRASNVSLGSLQTRLDYNFDGTINCTDINYNTIVSSILLLFY